MANYGNLTQLVLKATTGVLNCRVITVSGVGTGAVATAATSVPVGISAEFTKYPPGTSADSPSGTIAEAGDPIPYYGSGRMALAFVGAGGVTGGTLVEAGAAGAIVAKGAAGAGKWTVGWAVVTGVASAYVPVFIDPRANEA